MSIYKTVGATTVVKPAAGKLKGIFVSSVSGSPTIAFFDSFAETGAAKTIIASFVPVAATFYPFGQFDGIFATTGIRVEIGGTVVATVVFE
jgi:hypothetical protein